MHISYTPRYYADIGDHHIFPIREFEMVRDRLLGGGANSRRLARGLVRLTRARCNCIDNHVN